MYESEKIQVKPKINDLRLFKRSLIYNTKDFFNNSTLHGVKYIAEDGKSIIDKFIWACVTSFGTIAALIIIMSLWEKFQTNPTIIALDTNFNYPEIVFPTVVLCPAVQYDEEKINKTANWLADSLPKGDVDELKNFLKSLYNLSMNNLEYIYKEAERIDINLENANTSIRKIVLENVVDCNNVLRHFEFSDDEVGVCYKSFVPIYSEYGVCFGFNSKYRSTATHDIELEPPHSLHESGKEFSLYIDPAEGAILDIFVLWSKEYFDIRFGCLNTYANKKSVKISLFQDETRTTENTKQLSIKQRKCIFDGEIKLSYFSGYTQLSCIKNCLIKKAIKFCKCVPPFYRPVENIDMCDLKRFPCLIKHNVNLTNVIDCPCEIRCNNIYFDIEKMVNVNATVADSDLKHGIHVEILNWPIIRYKREILFGWIDLLVSFGGIAGLFLGFSLLSAVEIFYYFIIRACCMMHTEKKKLISIEEEIENRKTEKINLSLKIERPNKISSKLMEKPKNLKNKQLHRIKHRVQFINVNNIGEGIEQYPLANVHFYLP